LKLIPHALLAALASLATASAVAGPANLSLSLAQAQALASERNHDLKLARAAVVSAEAGVQVAGAAPNPVVGLSTSGIGPGVGSGALWRKQIDTVLSVSQLVERGNKRELRTESAQHNARAADADVQDVQRQLRVLVAIAYADLMAAQDKLAASLDGSQLLDATLAAAQTRRAAGDIAGVDVERVKVDTLRARNDIAVARGELGRARHALALLLGETAHAESLEAADSWPVLEEARPPEANVLAMLIDARADVRAAQARVEAAQSGTRLADALRTRDVTVGAQYEHYPPATDPNGASGNSVGVSVSMPLFTRYYYQGEIASAQAALDAAQVALERTRERASAEVGAALAQLGSAAERVRRNRDELLVAAEKAARAAEYAYQNGAVGVMDVLDARRTLRATRLDALAAQADFSKALAAWKAAIETADAERRVAAKN
jgi:cobalt-zinc-cadmium efflux system outer membrane protein